ncbi:MAG TPA: hypothetical protein VHX61_13250 [Rhizomicrobium sp.]|jgi:hypothetical protein|nr:hypothetical protein [Rhizomicrobium sp.]
MTDLTDRQILDAIRDALEAAARRAAKEARLQEMAVREGIADFNASDRLSRGTRHDRVGNSRNGELS